MATIWKYEIAQKSIQQIDLPEGAEVLAVQSQYDFPYIWALVNPSEPTKPREFHLYGTGHPIHQRESLAYVGTFQLQGGDLVFHLFEKINDL